jgi:RNA polymerase sigma-70 factor (ECF subfamily)
MEARNAAVLVSLPEREEDRGDANMIANIAGLSGDLPRSRISRSDTRAAAKETSDAVLIERIAAGNRLAMQVLYARHSKRVFRFALRFLNDESLAEEVVSDVFITVWRKAGSFESRSQVQTWLLAIARHRALSAARRKGWTQPLDDTEAEAIADPADNPESTIQKTQTSAVIRTCLQQLSPAHREMIDLVYYHHRSIDDIATIVGISANTVKTRMFYARKQLAKLLQAQGITTAA